MVKNMKPILEVNHLQVYYGKSKKKVCKDITFSIAEGEIVGLLGESGCGKSTLAKAILGMIAQKEGEIIHHSIKPQMIFQDPFQSLNPSKTIGWILEEPLRIQGGYSKEIRRERALQMLEKVGLEKKIALHYPRQLSGGQRQRVCIAVALMLEPKLLIADEPVSALDVTIQVQIIDLLLALQEEMGMAMLFISHDMAVVYQISDRIMIMEQGEILKQGETEEIFKCIHAQ